MSVWLSKARSKFSPLDELRTFGDMLFFCHVCLFAATVPLLLRLNLTTLQARLEPKHLPAEPTRTEMDKIVAWVDQAIKFGKPLVRPGCLTRGVTGYYFLKRAGADVTLCFGMGNFNGAFVGHCWLTYQGEPILEPTDPRKQFTQTYSIPRLHRDHRTA